MISESVCPSSYVLLPCSVIKQHDVNDENTSVFERRFYFLVPQKLLITLKEEGILAVKP